MEDVKKIKDEGLMKISEMKSLEEVEEFRIAYLSKKGLVQGLMMQMKDLPKEEKPKFGQVVNELKQELTKSLEEKKQELEEAKMNAELQSEKLDITLDEYTPHIGTKHPLNLIVEALEDCFVGLGYKIAEGPEVELDYYNFEKANIPADHPARDMQDTFYVDVNRLLRSQTTAIQMRVLEAQGNKLPIKVICPGKVYRRDDDDATHSHQFMQCEGLVIGENITVADLKGTLELMIKELFKNDAKIRFRPSYFPFTEPSFEVDMSCHKCGGKGCSICKDTGWIEILGSGMVHPNVLEAAGIDYKKYTGFAFGVGIERVAMLKYGVNDIRDFYTNDLRFLKGFKRSN